MGTTASSKLGPAQAQPSPASSGGSGSSTASPPPAASMGTTGTSPASSGGSGSSTTATTGREHGDDGIEQAGTGTSAVARPEAAVAPPPTEAIYQQVSSADYGHSGRSCSPTTAGSIESASQMVSLAAFCNLQ
ncbi:hypothetical protein PR001_g28712 [Phytophthora rubi]|uniref:Uncharacterized protein n=1 Tax=Phytophthora rubi TaxID=129364 RepID=A0A6A3H8N0_9STRA|nr:hypothetical protein PR001_g28712 [Phytophthora rubi]